MSKDPKVIICHPQILMEQFSAYDINSEFAAAWAALSFPVQSVAVSLAITWCRLRVDNYPDLGSRTIPTLELPTVGNDLLMACVALSFDVRLLKSGYVLFPAQVSWNFKDRIKSSDSVMPANATPERLRSAIALSNFLESNKRRVS